MMGIFALYPKQAFRIYLHHSPLQNRSIRFFPTQLAVCIFE